MRIRLLAVGSALTLGLMVQPAFAQQQCESLTSLKLPNTTITSATMVPEGPFVAPAGGRGAAANAPAAPPIIVPAHCDVRGTTRPTPDSEIKFAVWLPTASAWNGKYRQEGNGGFAGNLPLRAMIDPLTRGYAAAGTDDGHEGGGANWAIGHPEKWKDFGFRAVHETSVQAKAVMRALYGKDPSLSYFYGCSDGGREALMEAQRYPEDFNGIIAAAPAWNWSHLFTGFIWNEQALMKNSDSIIAPAKLPAIQKAVIAACDKLDGAIDGLLEDPRQCKFDPAVLTCKGVDKPDCLTPPQVAALKAIYAGPKNPKTGEQIFPGMPPGSEAAPGNWSNWITREIPEQATHFVYGNSYYGQAVYEDPNWSYKTFDYDKDLKFGDAKSGVPMNSDNPDLRSFRAHGGKLLQYHGWGDAAISAISSVDYYEMVRAFLTKYPDARSDASRPVDDFYRMFMVPGMGHCRGGWGPNQFGNSAGARPATWADPERDVFAAMERWVEKGVAPEQLIGTGTVMGDATKTMTHPLCMYPKVAQYKGGDVNDAASFTCAMPAKR